MLCYVTMLCYNLGRSSTVSFKSGDHCQAIDLGISFKRCCKAKSERSGQSPLRRGRTSVRANQSVSLPEHPRKMYTFNSSAAYPYLLPWPTSWIDRFFDFLPNSIKIYRKMLCYVIMLYYNFRMFLNRFLQER